MKACVVLGSLMSIVTSQPDPVYPWAASVFAVAEIGVIVGLDVG